MSEVLRHRESRQSFGRRVASGQKKPVSACSPFAHLAFLLQNRYATSVRQRKPSQGSIRLCQVWILSQAVPALKPDALLQISRISFLIYEMGATVVVSLVVYTLDDECRLLESRFCFYKPSASPVPKTVPGAH